MVQPAITISGNVHDLGGKPIGMARVYFIEGPEPFPDVAALTNHDGTFFLAAPSPGTYIIEAVADGFDPTAVIVTIGGGRTTRLEIRLNT